ncbi:MAG: hypothetical protein JJU27_05875 [Gammaproteobacteria bacterium]|nr:hypothetical protein [Gammaproteobacteria bacterium]
MINFPARGWPFGALLVALSACQPSVETDPLADPSLEAHTATTQLRMLSPGMQWTYQLSVEMDMGASTSPVMLSGEVDIRIEAEQLEGERVLAIVLEERIMPPTGAPSQMPEPTDADAPALPSSTIFGDSPAGPAKFYFRQTSDTGDVYFFADNQGPDGQPRLAEDGGQIFIPGQWHEATAYDNRLTWRDGGYIDNELHVTGTQVIDAPYGRFEAWHAPNSSVSSEGIRIHGTDWWVPDLGQPVRFEATTELPDGRVIRSAAILKDTNVSLP